MRRSLVAASVGRRSLDDVLFWLERSAHEVTDPKIGAGDCSPLGPFAAGAELPRAA